MKNPYDSENIEEIRDICLYWMQKSNRYLEEKNVMLEIMMENNINFSVSILNKRLNDYTKMISTEED
jgi:hypothetical protein